MDSSLPEFWDTRYRGGVMPWDAAGKEVWQVWRRRI
jgi:hypothetical protein